MVSRLRSRSVFSLVTILVTLAALSSDTHPVAARAGLPVEGAAVPETGTLLLAPEDTSLNLDAINYSTDTVLTTYTWPANKVANAVVMKFDLSLLPADAVVTGATLHLALVQSDNSPDATYTVSAHKVLGKNPVISTATGYTADGHTNWTPAACCSVPLAQADISAIYDQPAIDKTLGDKSWTITTMVQEWLAQPPTNFGLLLNSDASKPADRFRFFASMEHTDASLRPYLKVTYSSAAALNIALSATSVAAGATMTATITNGPGAAGDWVALVAEGASDSAYLDWKYLNGTRTRPAAGMTAAAVAFTMPATPGLYNLRFFLNDSWTKLATSATITVTTAAGPSIALSTTTVAPDGTVTATIANGPGYAGDWFGLYGAGAPDGTYLDWKYLNGTQTRPGTGVTGAAVAFTMPLTPGTYNVRFFVNDSWGKLATSATITVTSDAIPPAVSLTMPTSGATVSGTTTVAASASDNVAVGGVQFKLDGANLGAEDTSAPYSLSWDSTTVPNGSHSFTAVARDAAGNATTSAAIGATVANDTTSPSVSITGPVAGTTVSGAVTVAATAADNVGVVGVRFTLDGANLGVEDTTSPFSQSWTSSTSTNAAHTLTAVARDAAGNTTTSASVTVTVFNDAVPPAVSITSPTGGATVSSAITVAANASDNAGVAGVRFKLDGANLGAEDTTAPYTVGWSTLSATNGSHALTAVARDATGNQTTSSVVTVTVSNSNPGAGIAAQYPGDVGIENNPDVIFVERFDEASLTALFSRWTDILGSSRMSFNTDAPSGSPVPRSLDISWTGGGVSSGGHLYKVLSPGVDDTFYLRYYIKYPTTGKYMHHGIWTGGYNPPLNYPSPRAGTKPAGNDLFSAAAEQDDLTLRMDHYNYWMDMHLSNDGNWWGNLLLNDPDVFGKAGTWMCVEQMVKLNMPVTSSNGEHAIWVDGAKVSHVGPGFPNGSWSGGIFTQNPAGTPFPGVRWRSDANLNVNHIWLQTYAPNDPAGFTADMKFAHVVAAKSYIGCLTPASGGGDTTAPSVSMTAPASGTTVSGMTNVSANASDNLGVTGVQFKLDGVNLGAEDMASPYALSWNAAAASSGSHTLTAVARDAAGNTRTSTSVSVTVAVSPPTGGWPNEPSGMVTMTDQPWNALTGGGWNRRSGGTDQIISDSTAPMSPSNIMEYIYPVGFVDGWAPATQYYPVNGKEIFVGMWWKPSSPWQGNGSFVNKIQFFQVQNSSIYMAMYGPNGGPYELRTDAQWGEMGSQWITPNVNSGIVTLGQWHRLEWYLKYDSSYGARDGIIRWWMDGVLVGDYRNIPFPNDGGFVEYQISPTWGGNTGQAKNERDYYRFDHSYISKR